MRHIQHLLIMRAWLIIALFLFVPTTASSRENNEESNTLLDEVLKEHVSDGSVDYNGVLADARFAEFVRGLERGEPQKLPTPEERLAFWINAYNALAIQGILNGSSPRTFFGKIGFFYNDKYRVGGVVTNLYDLEHKILRPMGEPRIHFAIVCASKSCPTLRHEAYAARRLDSQLEDSTRRFINDRTRNRFDRVNKVAYLSKIFDWFSDDFSQSSGSVPKFVAHYVDDPELAKELAAGKYQIEYLEYLWDLNGTFSPSSKN